MGAAPMLPDDVTVDYALSGILAWIHVARERNQELTGGYTARTQTEQLLHVAGLSIEALRVAYGASE